jgi:hypothetical protein
LIYDIFHDDVSFTFGCKYKGVLMKMSMGYLNEWESKRNDKLDILEYFYKNVDDALYPLFYEIEEYD